MNAMVDPASSPDAPGSPVKVTRQRGGLEHASGIFAALEAMAKSTADYGPNTSEKIAQESVSDPIPSPIPEVEPTTGTELTEEYLFQEFADLVSQHQHSTTTQQPKPDVSHLETVALEELRNPVRSHEPNIFELATGLDVQLPPINEPRVEPNSVQSFNAIEASVAALKASFSDFAQPANVKDAADEQQELHVASEPVVFPAVSPVIEMQIAEREADVFSQDLPNTLLPQPRPQTDEQLHDRAVQNTVRDLLDVMALPDGAVQPQERALAADTLLRKLSTMPFVAKKELSGRVAIMETPPALIVSRLVRDPSIEIAGPLIENGNAVSDQDLFALIDSADLGKCRMIARRRAVSPAIAASLLACGDPGVILALVRNPDASLSPALLSELAELAKSQPALQAPLATRPDMTPKIAFDLFWSLPAELRRYVFSRFLTDSKTLEKVLRIALMDDGANADDKAWDGTSFPKEEDSEQVMTLLEQGLVVNAAKMIADLTHISLANARKIISDPGGEPLVVVFKAMGLPRTVFDEVVTRLKASSTASLSAERSANELRVLYDGLSFNKARVVLTYWDWLAEHELSSAVECEKQECHQQDSSPESHGSSGPGACEHAVGAM